MTAQLRKFRYFILIGMLALSLLAGGLAFAVQLGPFSPDNTAVRNPLLTPVFETGGGPDGNGVNVNAPKIGNCGAPDRQGLYKVSTCLEAVTEQLRLMAKNYVTALKDMTTQMTGIMAQQMLIVGTFLDADEQLDMQRDIQELTIRAQKDYHPSEQLCAYGSSIRSLANTEERARFNHLALNSMLVKQYSNNEATVAGTGMVTDLQSRIEKFKTLYCDPRDHNNQLWEMCMGTAYTAGAAALPPERLKRVNKDIDYHTTFVEPRTLDVDFTDASATPDEEDILALARNLYWERALDPSLEGTTKFDDQAYMAKRSLMARASLAHNTFTTIAGMKSKAPPAANPADEIRTGGAHLKAILKDFGISDTDIDTIYGKNPSYYAQMEILTKTLYQHPNFYTNLYDKPANVDRINTAMAAIRLMQLRDRFDSQTRRELLMASLMEDSLFPEESRVYSLIQSIAEGK